LVFSFLLQSKKIFTLHAAAVACEGKAVIFLGGNGYGKSTLASFFLQQNHTLISDDVLPIVEKKGKTWVLPASPSMNLSAKSVRRLGCQIKDPSGLQEHFRKHRYSLSDLNLKFCSEEIPLGAVYFIDRPTQDPQEQALVAIKPVSPSRALLDLLGNTRANTMIELSVQGFVMKMYSNLVAKVPIWHLQYPRKFEFLPVVYEKILHERHFYKGCVGVTG